MSQTINVALIGKGFMGRVHSNAWSQVQKFFNIPSKIVMHTVCGTIKEDTYAFAKRWGWANASNNWEEVVCNPDIDLIDIVTPNFLHYPIAKTALENNKHCACEKPLALNLHQAKELADLSKSKNLKTFVWFNYRRCPAIGLAYRLVHDGKIGEIRHIRAMYLQDWADENIPFAWRFDKSLAGSGAHGDLNAHIIDMTRFVSGLDITEISGALAHTFIIKRKDSNSYNKMHDVSVDDALLFLVRFNNGAIGSYEAARQAIGNQNRNTFEINGTKGSIRFDFERMNELEFYDATLPRSQQGWTKIMCTHAKDHPYVENWWPDAHLIGYEHTFVNQAFDIITSIIENKSILPLADFYDAYKTQKILDYALISAQEKKSISLKD